jgi:hypothetical protein
MNVGGGLPGTGDRATQGSPAKIAYCVAENEADNPWEPLHVEHGYPADVSTVTISAARARTTSRTTTYTGLGILKVVAGAMGQAGSNNILAGGHPLLSLGPEHAATIARDGYTKRQVKEFLFEHARFPLARLGDEYRTHLISRGARDAPDTMVAAVRSADDVSVIVVGGAGSTPAGSRPWGLDRRQGADREEGRHAAEDGRRASRPLTAPPTRAVSSGRRPLPTGRLVTTIGRHPRTRRWGLTMGFLRFPRESPPLYSRIGPCFKHPRESRYTRIVSP